MKKQLQLTLAALAALTLCVGCAVSDGSTASTATTPFEKVASMRGADVNVTDVSFEAKAYQGKKPGQQQRIARTFTGQPPVIPHTLDNFDEITLEENQCIECHGLARYKEKGAPKMGDSHFTGQQVSMARWQCNSCHVPQVDAPPLVKQTFVGNLPAQP